MVNRDNWVELEKFRNAFALLGDTTVTNYSAMTFTVKGFRDIVYPMTLENGTYFVFGNKGVAK